MLQAKYILLPSSFLQKVSPKPSGAQLQKLSVQLPSETFLALLYQIILHLNQHMLINTVGSHLYPNTLGRRYSDDWNVQDIVGCFPFNAQQNTMNIIKYRNWITGFKSVTSYSTVASFPGPAGKLGRAWERGYSTVCVSMTEKCTYAVFMRYFDN